MGKGFKHSEEAKEKIRQFHIGMKASEQTKKNISIALKGRKLPLEVRQKMAASRIGTKLTEEWKNKISFTHRTKGISKGRHNPRKGTGKSSEYKIYKDSPQYKEWRKSVFIRDNYTCQHCGAHSGNGKRLELNADHIKPYCLFPELKFEIDNGRTLCNPCHRKTPTFGKNRKQMTELVF